jgi:hypothetical protein
MSPQLHKALNVVYQLALFGVGVSGLAVIYVVSKQPGNLLSYYTIQSNIIVLIATALRIMALALAWPETHWLRRLQSSALLWILVTGLVFHFLLSDTWKPEGAAGYANLVLHYVVPAAMLINWMAFDPKTNARYTDALWGLTYPTFYLVASLMRGVIDGFYPYWFLNPIAPYPEGAGSYGQMTLLIGGLYLGFTLLGLLIVLINRRLAPNKA